MYRVRHTSEKTGIHIVDQVGPYTLNLGRIGQHVGDWKHISLSIENYRGVLQSIYLSQPAKGERIPADKLEYLNGRPVVYASLHNHATIMLQQKRYILM